MNEFEHGWQQTNSELIHAQFCNALQSSTLKCTCGALATAQGLCAWCADSGIPEIEHNPATHFFKDGLGLTFGLCDDDTNLMLQDEAVNLP